MVGGYTGLTVHTNNFLNELRAVPFHAATRGGGRRGRGREGGGEAGKEGERQGRRGRGREGGGEAGKEGERQGRRGKYMEARAPQCLLWGLRGRPGVCVGTTGEPFVGISMPSCCSLVLSST